MSAAPIQISLIVTLQNSRSSFASETTSAVLEGD